jgi:hypothetical protein
VHGFKKWFETSAKDGTNVKEACHYLVQLILETESQEKVDENAPSEQVDVTGPPAKSGCFC